MQNALALARRGLGITWPNPAVGCVIVREGEAEGPVVVGRGWTQSGGRPHAETEALARAGERAGGATAYVTLEPCSHHGKTPPCADALIDAGICRVLVAVTDPDERVSGRGIEMLTRAGIDVDIGLCEDEALDVNRGYFLRNNANRPFFSLKTATTLDSRIATESGLSQWITGPEARKFSHLLRATHDAIIVGARTAAVDNPSLTCRLPGLDRHSPVRIVADSRLSMPPDHDLIASAADTATWIYTTESADHGSASRLTEAGAVVIPVASGEDGRVDLKAMAADMAARGLTRVLVEGGGTLASGFLLAGLIDRYYSIRHPAIMGGDGVAAIASMNIRSLPNMIAFTYRASWSMGADFVEVFDRLDPPHNLE